MVMSKAGGKDDDGGKRLPLSLGPRQQLLRKVSFHI